MRDAKTTTGREIRSIIAVVVVAGLLSAPIFGLIGFALFSFITPERFRDVVAEPGDDFTYFTGLEWPATASIISVDDDHGGFQGEGVFHVVFDTDRVVLEKWLAKTPPWEQSEWKRGSLPPEIGVHHAFGSFDDHTLARILSSDANWYIAKERCCENLRWHNGTLLMIDLAKNRVLLSVWDF